MLSTGRRETARRGRDWPQDSFRSTSGLRGSYCAQRCHRFRRVAGSGRRHTPYRTYNNSFRRHPRRTTPQLHRGHRHATERISFQPAGTCQGYRGRPHDGTCRRAARRARNQRHLRADPARRQSPRSRAAMHALRCLPGSLPHGAGTLPAGLLRASAPLGRCRRKLCGRLHRVRLVQLFLPVVPPSAGLYPARQRSKKTRP